MFESWREGGLYHVGKFVSGALLQLLILRGDFGESSEVNHD